MRVLASLKANPLGSSHAANLASTCSACCPESSTRPGRRRTLPAPGCRALTSPACTPVRYRTPAASSSPCNAIFNNKGEITPPCGVPAPVGEYPFPASKTPAFSQPAIIRLAGKSPRIRAGARGRFCRTRQPGRRQESTPSWTSRTGFGTRILSRRGSRDPAETHTIGPRTGLPLRLQRLADTCLVAPVHDHWYAERAHLGPVTGFRYVHPPDRCGLPRVPGGVHLYRHLGSGLAGQRDLPVNPRGLAARVALRHLAHADQRVGPGPQRQLL